MKIIIRFICVFVCFFVLVLLWNYKYSYYYKCIVLFGYLCNLKIWDIELIK